MRDRARSAAAAELATLPRRPLISVVMPVYDAEPRHLRAAIGSVRAQHYPDWELVIVDDGSPRADTRKAVRAGRIPRSADHRAPARARTPASRRPPTRASSSAAASSSPSWTTTTSSHPMPCCGSRRSSRRREFDVAYSDQDKITADGARVDPFHKPDWSPVYALGAMYVGHLLVARRELLSEAGGFDPDFDTIQDFELMLRLSERTDRIRHIPETLYHWRAIPGQHRPVGAREGGRHRAPGPRGQRAPPTARHRGGGRPTRDDPPPGGACARPPGPSRPARRRVIVRPGRDRRGLVQPRPAGEPGRGLRGDGRVHRLPRRGHGDGRSPDWIEQLLLYAEMPGVGAVGPTITRPDGRVDSAGLRDRPLRPRRPGHARLRRGRDGYYGSLSCAREVSAVSMECMLMQALDFRAARRLRGGLFPAVPGSRPLPTDPGVGPQRRLRAVPANRRATPPRRSGARTST